MTAMQARLFGIPEAGTFDSVIDGPRIKSQVDRIEALMEDGVERTLAAIVAHIGAVSEAGVSARLRQLRNDRGRTVERRRMKPGSGTYLYRVVPR